MSNELPKVKVVNDKGYRLQWATGWFYQSDGLKKTLNGKKLKLISIILFVLISIAMILRNEKEPPLKA